MRLAAGWSVSWCALAVAGATTGAMIAAMSGCETGLTTPTPPSGAPALYLVTGCADATACAGANDLVAIDVAHGRAIKDVSLNGANAIAYRNGALLVAGGAGTARISTVDADTLEVIRTQLLPWDPGAAVFSADGTVMYAAHDDGYVSQVRVADGSVTAEIRVLPADGSTEPLSIVGLALDPTETFLGVTCFNGSSSGVAAIRITNQTLSVAFNWPSQPFASSNCSRDAAGPAFDRSGTALATFDRNCGAFDVYDLTSGALDPAASVLFARPDGSSLFSNTVADAGGRFWAANDGNLYRTSLSDATQEGTFSFDPSTGGLVTDEAGQTIYAFKGDPRTNGVFTIDPSSGAATQLSWNLDLVPLGAEVVTLTYASR